MLHAWRRYLDVSMHDACRHLLKKLAERVSMMAGTVTRPAQ
jgi:hypothetical protein